MALPQEMLDVLSRLDKETDEIGEFIRGLKEKISTGMSAEDVAAVHARLDTVANRLDGLAADPNNPVPNT